MGRRSIRERSREAFIPAKIAEKRIRIPSFRDFSCYFVSFGFRRRELAPAPPGTAVRPCGRFFARHAPGRPPGLRTCAEDYGGSSTAAASAATPFSMRDTARTRGIIVPPSSVSSTSSSATPHAPATKRT